MSTASEDRVTNKRLRVDENDLDDEEEGEDEDEDEQEDDISKESRPKYVYLVFACDCPQQDGKFRRYSEQHETQDTELIGVYALLKEANQAAKYEAEQGEEEESDSEDDEELFYWQDDEPDDWKARRVWVEQQAIKY